MHVAVCLSCDAHTKTSFKSRDEAVAYVGKYLCSTCLKDVMAGDDVLDTPCGSEWVIIDEADYTPDMSTGEVLKAAGYLDISEWALITQEGELT